MPQVPTKAQHLKDLVEFPRADVGEAICNLTLLTLPKASTGHALSVPNFQEVGT